MSKIENVTVYFVTTAAGSRVGPFYDKGVALHFEREQARLHGEREYARGSYGDMGVPGDNHHDHNKRGFQPK